jgi:peroxiredoxin family protein
MPTSKEGEKRNRLVIICSKGSLDMAYPPMMQGKMEKIKMPSIREMIKTAKDSGVKFHACSPTIDMMGLKREDLIPEVDDIIGAATYLELASEDAITLFI